MRNKRKEKVSVTPTALSMVPFLGPAVVVRNVILWGCFLPWCLLTFVSEANNQW
ncbi:MAG TPA: hypothetical protein PKA28_05735 [Methylomusa anaerophila]|uniref:Uncharacterized protein n=1 Tax=Methylomusa anaerophila TaxID=1930071 RepID=A0A348ALV6_9FIRM|nr:hypothetical protein [Methylomusa anaerophila]BBB92054.1 hypothetical protein MAMMFC1_02739 [Methylomusa anaerophila]HML87934.1 hypothetical protein [Methylomusa anaerophila]